MVQSNTAGWFFGIPFATLPWGTMVERGREAEIKRFQDLFPTNSVFIIQGLAGIGKQTFLQNILKVIDPKFQIKNFNVQGLSNDLLESKLKEFNFLTNDNLIIIHDLHKTNDFSFASRLITSLKNETRSKWIILTNKTLSLPKLERLDLCIFTLSGISVEEARRWITDLSKKHAISFSDGIDLQSIIDLSGGHPWFLKFLIAHYSKVGEKNWLQLRNEPEFKEFEKSLLENLSEEEKGTLREIASYFHGIPIEDFNKTSIKPSILTKLEDMFLIESGAKVKLTFPFLEALYAPKLTRIRAYKLFRFYKARCERDVPSVDDLHSLGTIALRLGRVSLVKEILTSMIPRVRHARHSQWALELFEGLEQIGEPLSPALQLAQVDFLNLVARYADGQQKVSKLENNSSSQIDSSTKFHLRRAQMWGLIMDGQYKKVVEDILQFLEQEVTHPTLEYVNNLNHLAFNYVFLGKFEEAKAAAEESLSLQATIPEGVSCYSNSFLVPAFDTCGEYAKALALAERFLESAIRNKDRIYQALLYRFMGKILTEIGQYSRAEDLIQQAYSTFIENENPFAKYSILSLEIRIAGLQGKYKVVKRLNDDCVQYLDLFPNQFSHLVTKYHQAIVEADQGNIEVAKDTLHSVRELALKTDCKPIYGRVVAKLADIDLIQGAFYEAHKKIELAKSLCSEMKDLLLQQINLGLEAKFLASQREYAKAINLLETSERIAASLETPYGRALALNRLADLYFRQGNIDKSKNLVEQSLALHRQLGDRRGEVDDLALMSKIAMKERRWQFASETEALRNRIIKEEEYKRLFPSSQITLALIAWRQENLHLTSSLCQWILENHINSWEEMAACKLLVIIGQEGALYSQASKRIEQLDTILSPSDRQNIDRFFTDFQIEQPREFFVTTNLGKKQITQEELIELSKTDFDLCINFISNEFNEKTLGNLYFGHGSILHILFETLVSSPGNIFSKEELYRIAWKGEYHPLAHDPKIYFMINRLRKLIEPSSTYRYILSSELGYYFNSHSSFCLIQRSKPQESTFLNTRQRTLLSLLQSLPFISNIDYRKRFQVSNATAYRDLKELTDKGLLFKEGDGRSVRYRQKDV